MKLVVLGGDARMIHLLGRLSLESELKVYNTPCPADILILPYLSTSGDEIINALDDEKYIFKEAVDTVKPKKVFAGRLSKEQKEYLKERKIELFDWFESEYLTLQNADLTAEGASQIVTKNLPIGSNTHLILGWGRVAKAVAKLFSQIGGKILVCARKQEARKDAEDSGFKAYDFAEIEPFLIADTVINTIPCLVLDKSKLKMLKNCKLVLDLASKPYGTDFEAAKELGITAQTAPGIPGIYTPEKAGLQMAMLVIKTLRGEEYE